MNGNTIVSNIVSRVQRANIWWQNRDIIEFVVSRAVYKSFTL